MSFRIRKIFYRIERQRIKRDIEKLFFKQVINSTDDMDKFEQNEMKKISPIKITWYDWLINYIPVLTKKCRWFKR